MCQWWLFVTYECIKMHCCFIHTFKIDVRVRYCKQVSMNVFSLNTNQLATEYYHILSQLLRAPHLLWTLISLSYFNYFQEFFFRKMWIICLYHSQCTLSWYAYWYCLIIIRCVRAIIRLTQSKLKNVTRQNLFLKGLKFWASC